MDRRDFIRLGILGGAAGTMTSGALADARLLLAAAGPAQVDLPAGLIDELAGAGVMDLRAGLDAGRFASLDLVNAYLARIEQLDRSGPTLRSVLETNASVFSFARARDSQRESGLVRHPLHGVPVMVKDNLDTAGVSNGEMHTTAGSLALMSSRPRRSATVVERLEAAGALLLGKTNLSEWANFRSQRSSSGWSGRGGQTRNPYVIDRNPCGSSSGSAVAVAAGLCAGAIGTETNGSIVCPAGVCGIVGLKPTVGLVSRAGIIPISATQDTAGPMTATVTDAAVMLSAIAGPDRRDPATAASADHVHGDYTQFLDGEGLKGARIGVMRRWMGRHEGVDRVFEQALATLREAGAVLVDPVEVDTWGEFGSDSYEVLKYEFKDGLNRYLQGRPGEGPRSLLEVINFNDAHADEEMRWFPQDILLAAQETGTLEDEPYLQALAKCRELSREQGLDRTLARDRLDAIVAPTNGPAWTIDLVNGDNWVGISSSSAAAVAGYPNITVPAGTVFGLPVGISLFAGAWAEPTLLRLAYAFEQRHGGRVLPQFRPTLGA